MDLLHDPTLHSPPTNAATPAPPLSPSSHLQSKRVRLTPISDQTSAGILNVDKEGGLVKDVRCINSRESSSAEEFQEISVAVTSQTTNDSNEFELGNQGHLLDIKIIQPSEEELVAALRVPGELTSPASKNHSEKSDGSEDVNKAPVVCEIFEDKVQKRVTSSSDPTFYVWDLDETLIIFQTLRSGRYAALYTDSKDPTEACELGKRWESLILDICDDYFFYKQVENFNEPSLLSLRDFDDGADLSHYDFDSDNLTLPVDTANKRKLAYRHRVVGELYEKGLESLLTRAQLEEWKNLYEATDVFTDGWLTAGRELLEACQRDNQQKNENQLEISGNGAGSLNIVDSDPVLQAKTSASNYNILVTSGTLVPSLVKCLLFRLDKYFHHLNSNGKASQVVKNNRKLVPPLPLKWLVYSSREVGKLQCFHWTRERVQSLPARFCVIGDGVDEYEAAHDLSWPFLKINLGPNAVYQLPAVTLDILDLHMKIIYDPSVI